MTENNEGIMSRNSSQPEDDDMSDVTIDRSDPDIRTALAAAQTEAAELRAEVEKRDARIKELMTLLHGAGGLLETNVRTKARDDHAEQKMIMLIRAALAQGTQPHE